MQKKDKQRKWHLFTQIFLYYLTGFLNFFFNEDDNSVLWRHLSSTTKLLAHIFNWEKSLSRWKPLKLIQPFILCKTGLSCSDATYPQHSSALWAVGVRPPVPYLGFCGSEPSDSVHGFFTCKSKRVPVTLTWNTTSSLAVHALTALNVDPALLTMIAIKYFPRFTAAVCSTKQCVSLLSHEQLPTALPQAPLVRKMFS